MTFGMFIFLQQSPQTQKCIIAQTVFMALRKKNTECILCGRDGEIDHEENVGKYGQIYSTILSKN